MQKTAQQKSADTEQNFPFAQHTDKCACGRHWLQQGNLTATNKHNCCTKFSVWSAHEFVCSQTALTAAKKSDCWTKFSVCSAYGFVCSQTTLIAANKYDCCAIFFVCLAYGIVCWQTMSYARQNKILHQIIMLPSIRIWMLGDRYWCSTSILYWVTCYETSDAWEVFHSM